MMFGQTAAVYAFLRFSRAIAAIAMQSFGLLLVEFFDDFTQIEPQVTASSAQDAFEGLVKLLGWELSITEEKRKPFHHQFVSLGIEVDLSEVSSGWLALRNKPGRVAGIKEQVRELLAREPCLMGFRDALSLRGKFAYAEGQTFGRVLAPLARLLSAWAMVGRRRPVSEEMRQGLTFAVTHLEAAGPRQIGPRRHQPPVLVFTDGACEDETSVGGVLFDGAVVEYFGAIVTEETVASWKSTTEQLQVIGQAELFPVLLAKLTWAERLEGRRVIYFLDNESARLALVRAYSPVLASLQIVMQCLSWDFAHHSDSWYARVSSVANISDGPSRLSAVELQGLFGGCAVAPVFPSGLAPAWVLT